MESTSISDVRRMCQCGAFRAYVQGGKVFLEDTATGQVVPLNGESGPANTERRAVPHREDRRGSRVERMFGARDTWKSADPDADQGPYRGFLIVQCEECGAIKAFCAKHETYGYKCGECGHETPLEKLRPLFMEHNAADSLTSIKGLGRKWSWESYHDEFIEAQELEKAQLTFDDLFPEAPGGCLCGAPCGCYDG